MIPMKAETYEIFDKNCVSAVYDDIIHVVKGGKNVVVYSEKGFGLEGIEEKLKGIDAAFVHMEMKKPQMKTYNMITASVEKCVGDIPIIWSAKQADEDRILIIARR